MSKPEEGQIEVPEDPETDAPDHGDTPAVDAPSKEGSEQGEPTLEEQLADARDKRLRAVAELENTRRRARADVEEMRRYGSTPLLLSLLPVLDTLKRALACEETDGNSALLEGVRLTQQQLTSALASHGITPVLAEPGTPFDPALHRALLEQPTADQDPGTIVTEIEGGWMLHDRLLREAQVVVARAPDPADD